jgi:hypothetical protein
MRHHAVLVLTMVAVGAACACSDDSGGGGNAAGTGGAAGMGGGAGMGGAGGTSGSAGSTNGGGAAGAPVPPTPALPPGSATVPCPTQISGSLDTSDGSQTGRHSRIAPISACGATKGYPGNAADPSNPHLFDVYRFANPTAAAVCFNFTLTDSSGAEAALDAGADSGLDAGAEGGLDAAAADAAVVSAAPQKYLTAYSTFYPTDLSLGFLGDVGDKLDAPQAMGITVPAGGTIDVVVYATNVAPAGVGSYGLSCSTQ